MHAYRVILIRRLGAIGKEFFLGDVIALEVFLCVCVLLWLIRRPRLHRSLRTVSRVVNEEFALSNGSSDNDLATLGASLLDNGTQGWAH